MAAIKNWLAVGVSFHPKVNSQSVSEHMCKMLDTEIKEKGKKSQSFIVIQIQRRVDIKVGIR